jgi:RNA polymerase sigma-70 factor (ECF subfamily)
MEHRNLVAYPDQTQSGGLTQTMRDDELIAGIRRGETSALESLYDLYAPRVLGLIRTIVSDVGLSEDILQEVFWQVWCKRATYSAERGSVRSWLFLLARSRAIDAKRSRESRPESPLDRAEPSASLDPSCEQWENAFDLAGPLAALPVEESQVVRLAFFEGLTHREIAEQLGQPLGTVKSRIRNGLRHLAQSMQTDGEENRS